MFWQGVLEGPGDIARVQLPLPMAWLAKAKEPQVRLLIAWDSPVNHATTDIWACRDVTVRLKPSPSEHALSASKYTRRRTSPLIDRTYSLSKERLEEKDIEASDDMWVVELSYDEVATYPIGVTVSPIQRIAFVAELSDGHGVPTPPHEDIQKLKVAQTMTQLASTTIPLPTTLLVTAK